MSLLLAPYNNAMRLGQGFNSYIQQICIDDAVVIKKDQAPNIGIACALQPVNNPFTDPPL